MKQMSKQVVDQLDNTKISRVLDVDDDAASLKLIYKTLPRVGFEVLEAENGEQALAVFDEQQDTISKTAVDESLPHRSSSEREEIAKAFLGVTTWQLACKALNVPVGYS